MARTLEYTQKLVVQACCNCGMDFGVPADFDSRRLSDKKTFFCPAGHPQSYIGKTDAQLRREAERREANALEEARIASAAAERAQRELTKVKKAQAAAVKRAKAALCPVDGCGRSFVQLKRHMDTKHPEFVGHDH